MRMRDRVAWMAAATFLFATIAVAQGTANNDSTKIPDSSSSGQEQADFALNLFSDTAPILALFGDQFAIQFLSQSFTWFDHIIFAAVPLGIVAAITAAICVQGPNIARAFIGRARENRATAELELMSSTSDEVCELHNGKSIVRVMGRPAITQIIIVPDLYKRLENETENETDTSCGIHTIQTAREVPGSDSVMTCTPYHGPAYRAVVHYSRMIRNVNPKAETREFVENGCSDPSPSPNIQINVSSHHSDGRQEGLEIFFATCFSIIVQLAAIPIAVITVYHGPTKEWLNMEPASYGLSCYICGSVALFAGMLTCSFVIEKSTIEYMWERTKLRESGNMGMQLFWIQRSQTVSDQSFGSGILLGGSKRYVLTSHRRDEGATNDTTENVQSENQESTNQDNAGLDSQTHAHDNHNITSKTTPSGQSALSQKIKKQAWHMGAIVGPVLGGVGFVTQFVGLRGLSWPCSIYQLGAIVVMALLRALVRRRLGHVPVHYPALKDYELDYFAHLLILHPQRLDPSFSSKELKKLPANICCWEIMTWSVSHPLRPFSESTPTSGTDNGIPHNADDSVGVSAEGSRHSSKASKPSFGRIWGHRQSKSDKGQKTWPITPSHSSQQLLKARERLGDLCRWTNPVSEVALALCRSIEHFMDTFFVKEKDRPSLDEVSWLIQSCVNNSTNETIDHIRIKIQRKSDKLWAIEIGKVEAALSLWMSSIQSKRRNIEDASRSLQSPTNWRRSKIDSKEQYCRIVGTDRRDGVLRRDISWWIGEDVLQLCASIPERNNEDKGLIIGFDSPKLDNNGSAEDDHFLAPYHVLAIVSRNTLPTILAQHLFTSFIWTIAKKLPKNCLRPRWKDSETAVNVQDGDRFVASEYEFNRTWYQPKLSQVTLSAVIKAITELNLGTPSEILLCMIPAFSSEDLLPNDRMLDLMPLADHGHRWSEAAESYGALLDSRMKKYSLRATESPEEQPKKLPGERFACAVVAATIDFLVLASEPYVHGNAAPPALAQSFTTLVEKLAEGFSHIIKFLIPFFEAQRRLDRLIAVFKIFGNQSDVFAEGDLQLDMKILLDLVGFSDHLTAILGKDSKVYYTCSGEFSDKSKLERDIFGWTPVHYALAFDPYLAYSLLRKNGNWKWAGDRLGRNAFHLCAIIGTERSLDIYRWMASRAAIAKAGKDGMTLAHLAACNGTAEYMAELAEDRQPMNEKDIWDRRPIHLAAQSGNLETIKKLCEIAGASILSDKDREGRTPLHACVHAQQGDVLETIQTLLELGAKPDTADNQGVTPLLIACKCDSKTLLDALLKTGPVEKTLDALLKKESVDRGDATDQVCRGPGTERDPSGQNCLHYVAQNPHLDKEFFEDILDRLIRLAGGVDVADNQGRTALDSAIISGQVAHAVLLLRKGADANHTDNAGCTCLHHAVVSDELDEDDFKIICDAVIGIIDVQDGSGETALYKAIISRKESRAMHLLQKGANFMLSKDTKDTPLTTAIRIGHEAVYKTIIESLGKAIRENHGGVTGEHDSAYIEYIVSAFNIACMYDKVACASQLVALDEFSLLWTSTPIHKAIYWERDLIVELLAAHPQANLSVLDGDVDPPLRYAAYYHVPSAKAILTKATASKDMLIQLLQQLLTLPPDTSDISGLFDIAFGRVLQLEDWRDDRSIFLQMAVRCGHLKTVTRLIKEGADPFQRDEDNWTCFDIARKYGFEAIANILSGYTPKSGSSPQNSDPGPLEPLHLVNHDYRILDQVKITQCDTHDHDDGGCHGLSHVEVLGTASSERATIRSKACISPAKKYFYFEVKVIQDSLSRFLGVGFCHEYWGEQESLMLGWYDGSCALHGDDGNVFNANVYESEISSDAGKIDGYGKDDVVGAGVNMETGVVYWTLNGKRLDPDGAGWAKMPVTGKVYPAIGIDLREEGVGLRVEVLLKESDNHKFLYKGPY